MEKKWNLEFSEYIKQREPNKLEKTKIWETAIGLQEVDGLKPSEYLIKNAKEHIEGKIDLDEVKYRINQYYKVKNNDDNEEADKVSVRIAEILNEKSFNFNYIELLNIHKRLFHGIYNHAGKFRDYNITKEEWVLNGDTVTYASYESIEPTLEYDFAQEKNFLYKNLSLEESITHLCHFASNVWQIHPFGEGNTRTTAVFIIKYLRTFGFNINNKVFANNSFYFRNALVRANYKNFEKNIFEDISFLKKFFFNLLTETKYELKNRFMHIDYKENLSLDEIKYTNLNLEELAILKIIKENPNVRQEEIAKLISKSLRTVKTRMINMQEKGLIDRKNGKRNGEWVILNREEESK